MHRRGREAAAAADFSENTQIRICETSDGEVSYVRYIHEDEVDDPDERGYYDDWYEHPYYDAGYDDYGYGYGYGYDDFYDYDYGYDYGYENPIERVVGRRGRDGGREWEKEKEREKERERQQAEQEEAEVLEYRRKMKQLARDQRQAAANREWLIRNYGS
ncbi:hypothetical protein LTR23_008196 [Exophiala sp. CCFEE 6169]|nr:hypothetical protein LTR23_008196 [Chaetothyriales sp. CCFEE 6169]